jgi:hypothetical protein
MESKHTDLEAIGDDYDPAKWTALDDDSDLSYIGTQPVLNTNATTQSVSNGTPPMFAELTRKAVNCHADGVPVGTFKPDHTTNPHLRRLVYRKLDRFGNPVSSCRLSELTAGPMYTAPSPTARI